MRLETRGPGRRLFAIVDRELPTSDDLSLIVRDGLPVHVQMMPTGHTNLQFLEPLGDSLKVLMVTDYSCRDARSLEKMTGLRELYLTIDSRREVDLSTLHNLRVFSGKWKTMGSVAACAALRELYVDAPTQQGLVGIQGPLVRLDVSSARQVNAVPDAAFSETLEDLSIHGATDLNVAALARYRNLKTLGFESCRRISGIHSLLDLDDLDLVSFERCPDIDDWKSLAELRARRIRVIDRNPFDAEFRHEMSTNGRWTFPSGYLPRPRSDPVAEFLLHPAFSAPLRIPEESTGELLEEDLPESWHRLSQQAQRDRFLHMWTRVLAWAGHAGAKEVVRTTGAGSEVSTEVEPFDESTMISLAQNGLSAGYFSLIDSAGSPLVRVEDSIEDGVVLYSPQPPVI